MKQIKNRITRMIVQYKFRCGERPEALILSYEAINAIHKDIEYDNDGTARYQGIRVIEPNEGIGIGQWEPC